MGLKLLEPLRDLFKDEVRELGVASACRTTWSTATRSPARAWACASWAR
jgi:GMP synthase PP-ATPase subunit